MEEDTVKIEKDVLFETFKSGLGCKYAAAILECEVGDSFLIPDEDDTNRNTVSRTAARRGMRVASRLAPPCSKTGKQQRRVWRIK